MSDDLGGVVPITVVVDMGVRKLCVKPLPGRKKGCPNYGDEKHCDCPPHAQPIADMIDLTQPVFAAYERYDLEAHEARYRANNTDRS